MNKICNLEWKNSKLCSKDDEDMWISDMIKCKSREYMYYIEKNMDHIELGFVELHQSATITPPKSKHKSVNEAKQCAKEHFLTYLTD